MVIIVIVIIVIMNNSNINNSNSNNSNCRILRAQNLSAGEQAISAAVNISRESARRGRGRMNMQAPRVWGFGSRI